MKHKLCLVFAIILFHNTSNAQVFEWANNSGSFTQDEGHDVATDSDGNVYTTGTFRYTTDFDPDEIGVLNITNNEASDVFVQKLNADGELVWAVGFGGESFDNGRAICTDQNNNVYVVGNFLGTADFDPDSTEVFNMTSAGADDAFVVKLTVDGDFVWAKQLGGLGVDEAYDVVVDNTGKVHITGRFQLSADFDPSMATSNLIATSSSDDLFVCKLDADGNFMWAKGAGGGGNDFGLSIDLDGSNNVITTGYFWGTVDFNPGDELFNIVSYGAMDIFILKLNSTGDFIWAKQMGSISYDLGYSVAVDNSGNIYSTGNFEGVADFDPNVGVFELTSFGFQDAYISKLNADGEFIWAKNVGSTFPEWGQSIALDNFNGVYITGFYQDIVDFDPGPGLATMNSEGYEDVFILKLDVAGNYVWAQSMGGDGSSFDGDRGQALTVDSDGNVFTTGWFFGQGDFDPSNDILSLTSNGNYDIFVQKLSQPGINDISSISEYAPTLYPNPSNGNSIVKLPITKGSIKAELFNASGQTVYSQIHRDNNQIELQQNLPCGIYTLQLTTEDGINRVIKWVIE